MSLQDWQKQQLLKTHNPTKEEIESLFRVIDRCISDASVEDISADLRFNTAYQAALELAKVALHASGYRLSAKDGYHWRMMMSIKFTMGNKSRANYLNVCRQTRNKSSYDTVGLSTLDDVEELLNEVKDFRQDVVDWLKQHHPDLLPNC